MFAADLFAQSALSFSGVTTVLASLCTSALGVL